MTDSQNTAARKIAFLQEQFRQQIPERIGELRELWRLFDGGENQEVLRDMHLKAHSLAGSAGSFGAPVVSKKARILELALKPVLEEQRRFSPVEREYISRALQGLEEVARLEFGRDGILVDPRLQPVTLENRLVLVVDDDPVLAEGIAAQLEQKGLVARICLDQDEFEQAWQAERPAAIIMDAALGDQESGGFEIIGELRRGETDLPPVIFMSVRDDFDARLQAARLGAARYLIKPLHMEKIAATVDSLLSQGAVEEYRVLIVDDDEALNEYYAAILADAGMIVEQITDPLQCLPSVRRFRPELVLMDVYMPNCSGLELAAVLRQDSDLNSMPIVFLSSEERIDRQLSALKLGGDDFLTKPVLPEHLLQVVSARLKRSRNMARLNEGLTNAYRESATLRKAMELHNLVSVTDPDGRITYANDKFCEVSGYSRAELVGRNHRIVNSGFHERAFFDEMWNTISSGNVWRGTLCNRSRDGHLYWVESTIIPFQDEDGLPYQYVSIRTDVTSLKKTEKLLAEKRLLLNLIRNGLTRFVSQTGVDGVAEYLLAGLLKLSGSEAGCLAEIGGNSDNDLPLRVHGFLGRDDATTARWRKSFRNDIASLPGLRSTVNKVLRTGQAEILNDLSPGDVEAAGGGDGLPVRNFACVPVWYGHEVVGLFGLCNREEGFGEADVEFLQPFAASYGAIIHGRRAMEREHNVREQLIIAKDSAEQASRLKSEFLSGISHELRTPLNAIIGFGQLLESDPEHVLSERQHENVNEILQAGKHLLGLIDNVLDLAKIEAGRMEVNRESVPLAEIIDETLGLMRSLAVKEEVSLHCDGNDFVNVSVEGDRVRLKQVVINLVSNAIKYNRPGGKVTISGGVHVDGRVIVEVRDTGIGMSSRDIANLFIPFNRSAHNRRQVEGTGIGLVLSRNLIQRMGGSIEVSSEPGRGSSFVLLLNGIRSAAD